ncbi:hypothetical protein ACLQ3C_05465 [Gordonia sp. DT30]|uniref:hypothetical protein n=1 Tax=unclassified Gordonia (in: high G+C Gram-positive bacteria) TaxID=2657482 RepID=UPI003CEBDCA8
MASSRMNPRPDRFTTVPRWFAALATVYGTALTFLAAAFILGASTWSHTATASASAIGDGFAHWWPSASLAAAIVAIILVSFGVAASRRRRSHARARLPRP